MANELKHGSVGTELTQAEWEAVGTHVVADQAVGDIIYADTTSQLLRLGVGATNEVLRVASGKPDWQATTFITALGTIATGVWQGTDVGVAYGGTGASTLTDGGVLLGSGTGAVTAMAVLTDGQMIVGNGSTDPVAESGATLRTSIGVGTGDSPTFTGLTLSGSSMYIGDTANGNMTQGLTVNQGAADDQIFALKSSDVASGLTNVVLSAHDVETDDFFTIGKAAADGTAHIQSIAEVGHANGLIIDSYAGPPNDTDTSSSTGAINMFVAQHNGSNVLVDMDAGRNALAVGEINSSGARLARMILKADDGELHLGNSTLVALDDEDDRQIIRALQREGSSSGIIDSEWDNPFYDYDKLHELGLAGEKDEEGFFLFPLQSRLHAHEGAMWQNYTEIRGMQEKLGVLESKLLAIEGVK